MFKISEKKNHAEDLFYEAADYVERNYQTLEASQLLELYGYYKQATCGPCDTEEPGWFRFDANRKWKSWSKHGDTSKEEACYMYVEFLNAVKPNWRVEQRQQQRDEQADSNVTTPLQHFTTGNAVSTLHHRQQQQQTEEYNAEEAKTVFDYVKENNVNKVRLLMDQASDVNVKDHNGMTLLHWAVDRGLKNMAAFLLNELYVDVNVVDDDGQTPLHYASFCEYTDVIKLLLNSGALIYIPDKNGLLPYQVTDNAEIRAMLYWNDAMA